MAQLAVCPMASAPVRAKPAHASEMVSQLLFGEQVYIQKRSADWCFVQCCWDNYEGWVHSDQLTNEENGIIELANAARSLEVAQPANTGDAFLSIPMGSLLRQYDGLRFRNANGYYNFSGLALRHTEVAITAELLTKIARRYLYAPYMWGGRSPFGIDCSGFVQVVYLMLGKALPRDASQQVSCGTVVDFVSEAAVGDLAFFINKKDKVTHVGIVLDNSQIIHASGQVRIDSLDHHGIYSEEKSKYSHKLKVIKRVIETVR